MSLLEHLDDIDVRDDDPAWTTACSYRRLVPCLAASACCCPMGSRWRYSASTTGPCAR